MKRNDDFETRREHLASLSDEELHARFWSCVEQLTDPLLTLGYDNTSPSIERSVLLRMGFSSVEAKAIVNGCLEHGLLQHGAGNVVYRLSKSEDKSIREAGEALVSGDAWERAERLFRGAKA